MRHDRERADSSHPPTGRRFLPVLALLAIAGAACAERPSDAEIERLRAEARELNERLTTWHGLPRRVERLVDRYARPFRPREERRWSLVISGRTRTGEAVRLGFSELEALATTRVRTRSPFEPDPFKVPIFRGVLVSTLLERVGVAEGVTELTFGAFDAFRSTIDIADARRYPIILAVERDGRPIPRNEGGPLFLVFPHLDEPATRTRYPDRFWSFYVTHMIVGTEPARVRVNGVELDGAALDALPQATLEREVGFKVDWPSGKVKLHGPRVRDVIAAAGVSLPPTAQVLVRGKPPIYRDERQPTLLTAAEVAGRDVILVTRIGDERTPLPARQGGPVALAYPTGFDLLPHVPALIPKPGRPRLSLERRWLTFVEELVVETPEPP